MPKSNFPTFQLLKVVYFVGFFFDFLLAEFFAGSGSLLFIGLEVLVVLLLGSAVFLFYCFWLKRVLAIGDLFVGCLYFKEFGSRCLIRVFVWVVFFLPKLGKPS